MFSIKTSVTALLFVTVSSAGAMAFGDEQDIGASLNKKFSVPIADVPAAVLAAVKAKRPAMTVLEAEKELKHNNQYFDIEGTDANGNEIELDLILTAAGSWEVVEIQRDIQWATVPLAVQHALTAKVSGVSPDRIIESDQDNGTVVYEFYTRNAEGKEAKYEVSLKAGVVQFLTEEWKH